MQTRDLHAIKRAKGRFALSITKYAFKSEKRSKSLKLQTCASYFETAKIVTLKRQKNRRVFIVT